MRAFTGMNVLVGLLATFGLSACKSPETTVTDADTPYASETVREPDFIIVENLAVTADDTMLLQGLGLNTGAAREQTDEEIQIGSAYSAALRDQVVVELRKRGIEAYNVHQAPPMTWRTALIDGYYFEGSGDSRLIGFGLGQSNVSMRLIFRVREVTIAEVTINNTTRLRRGMTEESTPRAVNTTVENEVRRAAAKIADEVLDSYKRRGWRM
jgi:hypothetical protein